MDRISHSTAVDIGGGRMGFRSKDTVAGIPGTVLTATHLNAEQEELVGAIEAAGLAPTAGDLTQITQVIRGGRLNWRAAGGTANALTIGLTPQLLAYVAGLPLRILTGANPNSGAMTLNVDGLGAKAIIRRSGAAMAADDVPANSLLSVVYDGVAFRVVGLAPSDIVTLMGGLVIPLAVQVFPASGTYTPTAGLVALHATMVGGGGGGGNASAPNFGGGGGNGAQTDGLYLASELSAGPTYPVTIGTGGTGAAISTVNPGGAGGNTSFLGLLARGGSGGGGSSGGNGAPGAGGSNAGAISSGRGYSLPGVGGVQGARMSNPTPLGTYGTGGIAGSGSSFGGGAGTAGIVIIREFIKA